MHGPLDGHLISQIHLQTFSKTKDALVLLLQAICFDFKLLLNAIRMLYNQY